MSIDKNIYNLPLIIINKSVILPSITQTIDISSNYSLKAVKNALENDTEIVIATSKNLFDDIPDSENIYTYGCLCKVEELKNESFGNIKLVTKGLYRCKILQVKKENFYMSNVSIMEDDLEAAAPQIQMLTKSIIKSVVDTCKLSKALVYDSQAIADLTTPRNFCYYITYNFLLDLEKQQNILSAFPLSQRLELLYSYLLEQLEILEMESRIKSRVQQQIEQNQKSFYLNEQIKSIQAELGNSISQEIDNYRSKLKTLSLNDETKQKLEQEINRYEQTPSASPESVVSRTYIEYILDMPWNKYTKDTLELDHARKILDAHHYGLDKVKERIIEFIAVLHKKNNMRGPILCFVGPPGVGKTSIVKSIAEALGRKFIQMSLGGVRDEAEIRGHRRTYVSAIPGRIVSSIKQAGTMNSLFLLDEIDKMSSDFRGDPASAMLEVLDSEQNSMFRDHYLDIPFDLSNVMFITTANSVDTIPIPLLDRMEIIEVSSYTYSEKLQIAKKHLLPKQLKEHGLSSNAVKINDKNLEIIIDGYTREAGVRSLERIIAKLIRKSIVKMLDNNNKTITITNSRINEFLGSRRYSVESLSKHPLEGVVNGLAYTPYGGVVLTIECLALEGNGKIHLTGKLGDVMKESADAALSWVRANYNILGLKCDFFNKTDIHIHVPEGAIPKDGPSAGITIAVALISILTHKKVRQDIAMTGEITLLGNILPIGGLKEKLFAAYRNNIYNVYIPKDNLKDLEEIAPTILDKINIIGINKINDVLEKVFLC